MIEKRTFDGGMNQDVEESLILPNQYRFAFNIRTSDSGQGARGVVTTIEGNRLVSTALPAGGNRVIGTYDDDTNNRTVYVVYNSNGDNRIYQYEHSADVITLIYSDIGNTLNLNPDYLITGIDVVVGEQDTYLLFTDNYGEPKNINIDAGIRTFDPVKKKFKGLWVPVFAYPGDVYYMVKTFRQPDGTVRNVDIYYRCTAGNNIAPAAANTPVPSDGWELCPSGYIYTAVNEDFTTAIVKPPLAPPVVNYSTNSVNKFNNLAGSLWQFKYCYVSEDGRESSWSPLSTFVNPMTVADSVVLSAVTTVRDQIYRNNELKVWVEVPDFIKYRYIKIAVRKNIDDRAPGDFYMFSKVDINDISGLISADPTGGTNYKLYYKATFDNTGNMLPLNQQGASQLFSWIPVKAKAQAITDRNRVVYANITEGYDIDLDGPYGFNSKPPTSKMFERSSPFYSNSLTRSKTLNGGVSITALSNGELWGNEYSPYLYNASGPTNGGVVGFPTAVTAGIPISLTVTLSYTFADPTLFNPSFTTESFTETIVPSTSSTSAVLTSFASKFQNNAVFSITNSNFPSFSQFTVFGLIASADTANNRLIFYPRIPVTLYTDNGQSFTVYIQMRDLVTVNSDFVLQSFKRGSNHEFGVVYSDKYGRLSSVLTHENLNLSSMWWRDTSVAGNSATPIAGNILNQVGQRYAQITLNHDAPAWAERYHIVKTNKNGLKRYVSFPLAKQKFLGARESIRAEYDLTAGTQLIFNELNDKFFYRGYIAPNSVLNSTTASTFTPTTADSIGGFQAIYIPLNGLTNMYNSSYSELSSSQISYSFTPGDRLRICYRVPTGFAIPQASNNYGDSSMDVEILTYFPEINCIAIRASSLPEFVLNGGNPFNPFNELFLKGNETSSPNVGRTLLEIYTPDNESENSYFYEMYSGDIDKSNPGRYLHNGSVSNQTISTAAVINLFNGDTFLKPRTYVVVFDNTTSSAISNSADTFMYKFYVEEQNYYDKVRSKSWGAGRPNVTIKSSSQSDEYAGTIKAYTRPTTMRYSEPLLPNQGFNGLGTIYDVSFKDANPSLRSIQFLHSDGGKTYVFHEDAVGVMQNDRQVITTVDGQNLSIAANTPVSDISYYSTRAGIGTNPESFAYMNNRKYFFDADQGQVCRLSTDGITPINMYGMDRYFKQVSRSMNTNVFQDFAFGGYDKRFDEYILSFKIGFKQTFTPGQIALGVNTFTVGINTAATDVYLGQIATLFIPGNNNPTPGQGLAPAEYSIYVSNISGSNVTYTISERGFNDLSSALLLFLSVQIGLFTSQTIAFNEAANCWSSFYGYVPDMISSAGVQLVTYRAGALYVHDQSASPMRFYGTNQDGYIDIVSNAEPAQVKIWNTMSLNTLYTNQTDTSALSIPATDTTIVDQSMTSGVQTSNSYWTSGTGFVYKEQQAFTDYMRTIPRPTGATNFIEGDKVRGYWQRTRIKFAGGTVKVARIISATFNYFMSNYTR
jgi:hypothetical protein